MLNHKSVTFFFILLFLFSISTTFAQEVRSLKKFERISLEGNVNIQIVKSSKNEVKIENADVDFFKQLEIEVENNHLKIGFKKGSNWESDDSKKLTIIVYHTEKLEKLSLAGSGSIEWKGELYSTLLDINLIGSGEIYGRIVVSDLKVNMTGSGKICLQGMAKKQTANITSGDYLVKDLKSKKTIIKSTHTDIRIN